VSLTTHQSSIAGYRILERLGSGATSDVFVAVDGERRDTPEERIVLKLLSLQCGSDHERLAQLKREIAAFRSLTAPSVVRLKDAFAVDEQCVLILEYVPGVSLEKLLELLGPGERPDDAVLVYMMERIFAALAAAHGRKDAAGKLQSITHSEMRLSNVLLSWDGDIKLADFGITKIFHGATGKSYAALQSSSSYLAPEEARGESSTPASDIYRASLLLWELFSAHVPEQRRARTADELRAALIQPKIPALELLRPDLPKAICEVLTRGLEVDPAKRGITAADVAEALSSRLPLHQGRAQLVELLSRWRPADFKMPSDAPAAPTPAVVASEESGGRPAVDRDSVFPTANAAPAEVFRSMIPAGAPARRQERRHRQSAYPGLAGTLAIGEDSVDGSEGEGEEQNGVSPAPPPLPVRQPLLTEPEALPPSAITPSAVAIPTPPPPKPASRRVAWGILGFVAVATALLWCSRSGPKPDTVIATAPSETATATATPPPVTPAVKETPVTPVATTVAAVQPSATPAVPDAGVGADAPPSGQGDIRTRASAKGHRVFVDGKVVGSGEDTFRVGCGKHTVRIGSSGAEEEVRVPCGGEVTLAH
jgi:serine/threonine protein kinase